MFVQVFVPETCTNYKLYMSNSLPSLSITDSKEGKAWCFNSLILAGAIHNINY